MKKIAAALVALAIAGCAQQLGDGSRLEPTGKTVRIDQGEWQSQCVSSHVDAYPIAMPVSGPNGTVTIQMQMQMQYTTVCDRYEPVCVAGKDGSTECPVR